MWFKVFHCISVSCRQVLLELSFTRAGPFRTLQNMHGHVLELHSLFRIRSNWCWVRDFQGMLSLNKRERYVWTDFILLWHDRELDDLFPRSSGPLYPIIHPWIQRTGTQILWCDCYSSFYHSWLDIHPSNYMLNIWIVYFKCICHWVTPNGILKLEESVEDSDNYPNCGLFFPYRNVP